MKKNTLSGKKGKISYESIIAGALLKFSSLDNLDISLLIDDIEKNLNKDTIYSDGELNEIQKYCIESYNGTIKLHGNLTLDYFEIEKKSTIRKILKSIAGNEIVHYFNKFDMEKYKIEKAKKLKENKERVLRDSNVLLISDVQEDYNELIKYGFKNVDYFKSIVRANSYFSSHPEELEKYQLILSGNQEVQKCFFGNRDDLVYKISELESFKNVIHAPIIKFDTLEEKENLFSYLVYKKRKVRWKSTFKNHQDFFDKIVENMLINHILDKVDLKDQKFNPISDYINPDRLPLPTKKEDLKILYVDFTRNYCLVARIAWELGLNIDIQAENACVLGESVKNKLGDYDIIIVSKMNSGNILLMNHESTEQCKDTGRELTLFVSYEKENFGIDECLANGFNLRYVYGGNYAPDYEVHNEIISVLKGETPTESTYSTIKSIISSSVNFYNQALLENEKSGIVDLDLRNSNEINEEYYAAYKKRELANKSKLAFLNVYDEIKFMIFDYLWFKNKKILNKLPEGLKIIDGTESVRVEISYQGRVLSSITLSKNNEPDDLRIFEIQTLSKKGILSEPETVGIYPCQYENLEGIPNRLNEKQISSLLAIQKNIKYCLEPLNADARRKFIEQEAKEQTKLNLKRKNHKVKKDS